MLASVSRLACGGSCLRPSCAQAPAPPSCFPRLSPAHGLVLSGVTFPRKEERLCTRMSREVTTVRDSTWSTHTSLSVCGVSCPSAALCLFPFLLLQSQGYFLLFFFLLLLLALAEMLKNGICHYVKGYDPFEGI